MATDPIPTVEVDRILIAVTNKVLKIAYSLQHG